ncbi:MAG: cytochrome c [Deltaproteobacteria bacterium]|nr:cytochrome c [Deltaproteobacteria bacterium]
MRNSIVGLVALVVSFAFAGTVFADGAAIYKAKCAACHGQKGEGMKGMAPAQKGNEFITKGKADDIKKVIVDGRAGAAKKFKEFAIDMPKSGLSDADATELVKFLQGDLQK